MSDRPPSTVPLAAAATVLAPLHRQTTGEQVADLLITAIAVGEFSPGERLPPERALIGQLGVSRSSVREALQRVAALGLVEVRRGRLGGAYVRPGQPPPDAVRRTLAPRWRRIEEVSDFRRLIEGLIARTAAERRRKADLAAMRAALAAYEDATSMERARAADAALHLAVARAARNEQLVALSRQLLAELSLGFAAEPFTKRIYDRALPQHRGLVRLIEERAAEEAFRLAADHFSITADAHRRMLRRVRGAGSRQA